MEQQSPVLPIDCGLPEAHLAKDQPEYHTLPVVVGHGPEYRMTARFRFTEEERAAIAAGADLMITTLTFGRALQPLLPWLLNINIPIFQEGERTIREVVGAKEKE